MNHSNKDGKPLAESAEERPLIKENARQPNTYPTQSGKGVSQGLAGVRKAAKENKEMKFTALLHHLTVDLLRESFYSLKRKAAPGVDGVTWQEYEPGLEDRFVEPYHADNFWHEKADVGESLPVNAEFTTFRYMPQVRQQPMAQSRKQYLRLHYLQGQSYRTDFRWSQQ